MAPVRKTVRLAKQYTNWRGSVFRRYVTPDGRVTEICIRHGRDGRNGAGFLDITYADAKKQAIAELYPPGRR